MVKGAIELRPQLRRMVVRTCAFHCVSRRLRAYCAVHVQFGLKIFPEYYPPLCADVASDVARANRLATG